MLVLSISILSFIGFCVLGFYCHYYRNKAIECSIKYNSTKDFAENAAKKILELEAVKSEMSATIVENNRIIGKYKAGEEEIQKALKDISNPPTRNRGAK